MLKFSSFVLILILSLMSSSYAFIVSPAPVISANPSDIYTIVATPIEGHSAYELAVYQEDGGVAVMVTTRSLDGYIADIVIRDIDSDGKEELVVFMKEELVELQKLHFDVFEFERNNLKWVEDFQNSDDLLSLFQTI